MIRRAARGRWSFVGAHARPVLLLALLALLAGSCAYYNTYYMARKYYDRATQGEPYATEDISSTDLVNYNKAADYSKKVIANYPKDKWADDAYLLWARALIGKEDPEQTIKMLRDFDTRYPKSPLRDEAVFYLGLGAKRAHKYEDALVALDEFLKRAPKHRLAPYALLERTDALMSLRRPGEAVATATQMLERFPRSKLRGRGLAARAEALLADGKHEQARADYHALGQRSRTDDERFEFLLKEADCLEKGRSYAAEMGLLRDAMSHELEPATADTGRAASNWVPQPTNERYAQLLLRIGSVHALEGRQADALAAYRRVLASFPHLPLGAEAQFRIAYVYETLADDFEKARTEYGKVRDQSSASPFAVQASQRLVNLDRLTQYRGAGVDSVGKKVETGLLLAELYLFQLDKPERALEEYRKIAASYPGTPHAAKAMNAEAWVLRNKLKNSTAADSLLWAVVRGYPGTEPQVQARDYLEFAGQVVPAELIKLPESMLARADSASLSPPLVSPDRPGGAFATGADTVLRPDFSRLRGVPLQARLGWNPPPRLLVPPRTPPLDDPPRPEISPRATAGGVPDSTVRRAPLAAPRPAPRDTVRGHP